MRTNIRAREEDSSQSIDASVRATYRCVSPKPHGHHDHLKCPTLIACTVAYFLTDPRKSMEILLYILKAHVVIDSMKS
jgi:hypothetical protein